jgi:hypothetical protein
VADRDLAVEPGQALRPEGSEFAGGDEIDVKGPEVVEPSGRGDRIRGAMGECEREHCEVHPQEGALSEWRALTSTLDSRNRTWSCVPAAHQSEPDGESEQGGTEHRQGGGFRDRGGQFEDAGAA